MVLKNSEIISFFILHLVYKHVIGDALDDLKTAIKF